METTVMNAFWRDFLAIQMYDLCVVEAQRVV